MSKIIDRVLGGTIYSGIAGEYFVAAELSRMGYFASLTLGNAPYIDILASNGEKAVNIQVKTSRADRSDGWDLGNKGLTCEDKWENTFYVLVELFGNPMNSAVSYYIIPKNELHSRVEKVFQDWQKGKNSLTGKARTSERRRFKIKEHPDFKIEEYKDRWDKLFHIKNSTRKCLCDNPTCAKCLSKNCIDKDCQIHTKQMKMARREYEIKNGLIENS